MHLRLARGFVVDTRLEGDARIVTFANGLVARELIVDIDDKARRLVWAAVGGRASHYNASLQVFAEGEGASRAVWIADLLPHDLAGPIGAMIEEGCAAIKRTLEERRARADRAALLRRAAGANSGRRNFSHGSRLIDAR